jgi:dihydrofolate reductase
LKAPPRLAPLVGLTLIVAVAENGIIGNQGKIPWHIPDDLKRFKRLTMGHPIVMGRKTWESIGRPLPGRENVVVTRQESYHAPGAVVVRSLAAALVGRTDAFVIGGSEIYKEALPLADRIELTRVHASYDGDASFPRLGSEWREISKEAHSDGAPPFEFVTLERAP